jgi:hypothetical protein
VVILRQVHAVRVTQIWRDVVHTLFFFIEGPRSRCYGRTAALRLIVQPCDEGEGFFLHFDFNVAPVE